MTTCPDETFATLTDAHNTLLERRARAALSGSPSPIGRHAYTCTTCGKAHITRGDAPAPMDSVG